MKKVITTDKAPAGTGPYSQALLSGELVFVAGQGPLHPVTHEIIGKDIVEQTRNTLNNIKSILEASGSGMDKVLKVNVYLSDIQDYDNFNKTYQEYFKPPFPVRTTIGCNLFDIKIEVDVIAEK